MSPIPLKRLIPATQVVTRGTMILRALRRFVAIVLAIVAAEAVVSLLFSLWGFKFIGAFVLLVMASGLGLLIIGGIPGAAPFEAPVGGLKDERNRRFSGASETTSVALILRGLALLGVTTVLVLLLPRSWLY